MLIIKLTVQSGKHALGNALGYTVLIDVIRQAAALGHKEYEKVEVSPVTTAEYGVSKAVRPFNSRLDKSKLVKNGFQPLPTWQDALERYLKEIL